MLLLTARHGETDLPGKCRGRRTHCALTPQGVEQTQQNLERMHASGARIVYTSSLTRAFTAGLIAREEYGMEHRVLPDLDAIDAGDWEGMPWKDVKRRWPQELWLCDTDARRAVIPGGLETVDAFASRIVRGLETITRACRDDARDAMPIGVVTHGCVIGVIDAIAHDCDVVSLRDKNLPPGALRAYVVAGDTILPAEAVFPSGS